LLWRWFFSSARKEPDAQRYAIAIATFGLADFLYQDLFPQWWHWGRWAGQFSDELSDDAVEFLGISLMF
jgi:hypothetical protein